MGIATSGSVLGTLIGMFFLMLFTPILGEVALKFGAYEFFWLAVFGVVIAGTLTGDDPLKGWIAGLLGVLLACVGQEAIYAYDRFSFGNRDLAGGFNLVPALVGAFGFAELLVASRERATPVKISPFDSVVPNWPMSRATGAPSSARESSAHSWASCLAWARTLPPGRRMLPRSARARNRRPSARAPSTD